MPLSRFLYSLSLSMLLLIFFCLALVKRIDFYYLTSDYVGIFKNLYVYNCCLGVEQWEGEHSDDDYDHSKVCTILRNILYHFSLHGRSDKCLTADRCSTQMRRWCINVSYISTKSQQGKRLHRSSPGYDVISGPMRWFLGFGYHVTNKYSKSLMKFFSTSLGIMW